MAFLATIGAGVGIASGVYGIGKSLFQSSKANKIDAGNGRPSYTVPQEYLDNLAMAKQMSQVGLPQQQYNNQLNAINQNQAGAVSQLSRSANPGVGLAGIVRQGNNAVSGLNMQDAIARNNNQRLFMQQNSQLGQQKLAQQQYNNFDKYTENYNESAALKGAANQNLMNGVNGLTGAVAGLYGMSQQSNTPKQPQPTLGVRVQPMSLTAAQQAPYTLGLQQAPNTFDNPVGMGVYPRYANQAQANPFSPFSYGQNYL